MGQANPSLSTAPMPGYAMGQANPSLSAAPMPGYAMGQANPATFLHAAQAPSNVGKPLRVLDHLNQASGVVEEEIPVVGRDGTMLVLKTGPKKPRAESITPQQWFAANCRILSSMLASSTN